MSNMKRENIIGKEITYYNYGKKSAAAAASLKENAGEGRGDWLERLIGGLARERHRL
jgi:hypothetical protein